MAIDKTKLIFHSGTNYMKRSTFCGSATITLPAYGSTVSYTVTHNLGYIPFFQIFSDIDNTDSIWTPYKLDQYTDTGLSGVDPAVPRLDSWVTTTTLVISITNNTSPTATGTRAIYWLIYKDYNA